MTRGAGGPSGADIFNQFFGGGGGGPGGGFNFGFDFGPGRRPGRGDDSVIPYDVTLEDLYNGKTVKMEMEKEVVCGTCKGYVGRHCCLMTKLSEIQLWWQRRR
jgi:DnaJ family protein A protein 2